MDTDRTARLPDWPARLARVVAGRLAEPFRWGTHDCVAFAADCVQAMTGADRLAALRGPRASAREARRLQRALGGVAALARCGLAPIDPARAGRGDLVLLRQAGHPVLAVCVGDAALCPGPQGLRSAGLERALRAWRV